MTNQPPHLPKTHLYINIPCLSYTVLLCCILGFIPKTGWKSDNDHDSKRGNFSFLGSHVNRRLPANITYTAVTNANRFGATTVGTYSGPNYAPTTTMGTPPQDVLTGIPNAGGTYTIRLFNGADDCYKDTTVTVAGVSCNSEPLLTCGKAVMTCHATTDISDPTQRFVVAIADTRLRPANYSDIGSPYSHLWEPSTYHHSDWTTDKLGNLFGLTTDTNGNIYVAAIGQAPDPSFYNPIPGFGSIGGYDPLNPTSPASIAAGGVVYKLDAITGAPSVFATLPQQQMPSPENSFHAPGLGQVEYDKAHNQLFVSNFEDGKIYRLSMTGVVLSVFDPLAADNGAPGRAPEAQRVWALAVGKNDSRLYYSINRNNVRSVGLTLSGDFDAPTDQAEFSLPFTLNYTHISDITFKDDQSKMLIAQRTTFYDNPPGFAASYNHNAMAYLYDYDAGTGTATLNRTVQVGDDRESYGGADFGTLNVDPISGTVTGYDEMYWFSSADILNIQGPHGLMAVPESQLGYLASGNLAGGNGSNYTAHRGQVYVMDYDGNLTQDSKGTGGDVDIFTFNCLLNTCTVPTAITLTQTAPTCTGATPNNNGKITLTAVTNADKFGVSAGMTYTGVNYAAATAIGTLPQDVQTGIPNAGGTYTIRLFNGADDCFMDTTVTVAEQNCCPPKICLPVTIIRN